MVEGPSAFRPTISPQYEIICGVGSGGYGDILKGIDLTNNNIVALKRFKSFDNHTGVPKSFYRERKCLEKFKGHPNIVTYHGVFSSVEDFSLYLVMEYCEYDLKKMIENRLISNYQKRDFIWQILNGLSALHGNNFIHRDMKPSNILVTKDNIVKLADFGLTREATSRQPLTSRIMTLNYRPVDIILGNDSYDQSVDIWSTACVIYEILTGEVLFKCENNVAVNQLNSIFKICGTPNQEKWPGLDKCLNLLPFQLITTTFESRLHEHLENTIPAEFQTIIPLLEAMLEYNPKNRITIDEILKHPFFHEDSISQFDLSTKNPETTDIRLSHSDFSASTEITSFIESDHEEFQLSNYQYPEQHSIQTKHSTKSKLTPKSKRVRNDLRPERILPTLVQ